MVGSFLRLAAVAVFFAALAGCTSGPGPYGAYDGGPGAARPGTPLQCVPYARDRAHIPIYGDASTWWDQAGGQFARNSQPSDGSVMVLYNYAGPDRAHLAVVSRIVDAREIRVDHANWFDDGTVSLDDPVLDVSPGNDWTAVRVFNARTGSWGTRVYDVQGFIGPGRDQGPPPESQPPVTAARQNDDIARLLTSNGDIDEGNY